MNIDTSTCSIFVRGHTLVSKAILRYKKENNEPFVYIRDEISTKPGLAVFERYLDPKDDQSIVIDGDHVIKYPKLEQFALYEFEVQKLRVNSNGEMVIKEGTATLIERPWPVVASERHQQSCGS